MEPIEQLEERARQYFLTGGGGFEGREDDMRAITFSFGAMCYMAAAFAEHILSVRVPNEAPVPPADALWAGMAKSVRLVKEQSGGDESDFWRLDTDYHTRPPNCS